MLAARMGARRAEVSSSETNALEWVVRIRLLHVGAMLDRGALCADHDSMLCHRVAKALLETVLISGHADVSSAEPADVVRHMEDKSVSSIKVF